MKKRTQDEINIQIEGLKKDKERLPQFSFFGDNNWDSIDAQLDILEGHKIASDFDDDEIIEEDEIAENSAIREAAERAEDWLEGRIDDNLFDE